MKNYHEPNSCATCSHSRMDVSIASPAHLPRDQSRPFTMLCGVYGTLIPDLAAHAPFKGEPPADLVESCKARRAWLDSHMVERHGTCDLWSAR